MTDAPERIWLAWRPGLAVTSGLLASKPRTEYIRADTVAEARIEELEAENKKLNEQMDAIEEMGTESLNALPDCLMRLAPALVENGELKAKLAKAVEALRFYAEGEWPEDYPGGVLYAAGDDTPEFKTHLDYGDKARAFLATINPEGGTDDKA